ncbi:hypothetical protein E4T47_05515 [Aureobasidium subglaciale]|nr:hypothetical protein E4T47_05515 [Aureobasidium subglaciale]
MSYDDNDFMDTESSNLGNMDHDMDLDESSLNVADSSPSKSSPGTDPTSPVPGSDSNSGSSSSSDSDPEWHANNAVLSWIGLKRLNDMGYVNLTTIDTHKTFGYSGDRALKAARWRAEKEVNMGLCHRITETPKAGRPRRGHGKLDDFHRIHPIFRADNWSSDDLIITTAQNGYWERLKPVLQLATLLLEDESIVGYIYAFLDVNSHKEIALQDAKNGTQSKAYCFKKRDNIGEPERRQVWKYMYELSTNLWWTEQELAGEKKSWHAYTSGKRGSIEIFLDKAHIGHVCREVSPVQDAIDWEPGSDEESARLRAKFGLATTMVHEVMHALWRNNNYPSPEPFYMDTRTAELGFQWEQIMYSGVIDSATATLDTGAPYCLTIYRWPSPEEGTERPKESRMSHKKWGGTDVVHEYAVEMSFVQNMFTHDFWAEVDRFGIGMFSPRRMLGVRYYESTKLWEGEIPTIGGPGALEPVSPVYADAHGIIDRHGVSHTATDLGFGKSIFATKN